MNKLLKGVIAGSLLLMGAANANAGTIFFTNCLSTCSSIDASDGDVVSSVANLSFSGNGSGGVDFVLTNTMANLFPLDTSAFIGQLFFNTAIAPTSIINQSANIQSITPGSVTNASIQFDVLADFANSGGPGNLRINNGESASWTFTGFAESDVLLPAMVHIQATAFNGGSVKVTDGGTIVEDPFPVPEPGILLLLGSALMGLALGKKRKAKA
jgi:hypothetical protein